MKGLEPLTYRPKRYVLPLNTTLCKTIKSGRNRRTRTFSNGFKVHRTTCYAIFLKLVRMKGLEPLTYRPKRYVLPLNTTLCKTIKSGRNRRTRTFANGFKVHCTTCYAILLKIVNPKYKKIK